MRVVGTILFALFLIASAYAPAARGQSGPVTPDLEEGMKAFGDFSGGDIDQISLSSQKLVLNIPLICYPQRSGKIKLCFSVRWQNSTPRLTETYYSNTDTYIDDPERDRNAYADQGQLDFVDNLGGWSTSGPNVNWSQVFSPDNNLHQMLYVSSTGNFESNDATGLSYNANSNTLMMPDGVRYIYSTNGSLAKVEDPNGNFVTPTLNGTQIIAWTDTLGRSIPTPLSATSTTDHTHCTGANPISSASTWTVPGPNGGSETFKFCYASYSYNWSYDPHTGSGPQVFAGSLSMLQTIVLPNLTTWTFQYEPTYAQLSQITLPTGGTISYTWGLSGAPCQHSVTSNSRQGTTTTKWGWSVAVGSRTVNANDGTGAKTWTYSGGTITDPLGNQSVHTMTGLGWNRLYLRNAGQVLSGL